MNIKIKNRAVPGSLCYMPLVLSLTEAVILCIQTDQPSQMIHRLIRHHYRHSRDFTEIGKLKVPPLPVSFMYWLI